jgi:hypothetical protein
MALTITIPGAVEATIGATAPAILTVGVGVPGATGPAGATGAQGPQGDPGEGVPAGGSAGQVLAKVDGVDYNTEWVNVEGDYLPLAGGAMDANASITIADTSTGTDSEVAGWGLGVQLSADHTKGTTVEFDGLDAYDGASHMQVTPTGITFPDATVQTTAFTDSYLPLAGGSMDNDAQISFSATAGNVAYLSASSLFFEDTAGNEANLSASSLSTGQGGGDVTTITPGKVELVFDEVALPFTIDVNGITFPDATVQTTAFTDSYLPLAGGTMVGSINFNDTVSKVIQSYDDSEGGTIPGDEYYSAYSLSDLSFRAQNYSDDGEGGVNPPTLTYGSKLSGYGLSFVNFNGSSRASTMVYGQTFITFGNATTQTTAFPGFNNAALTGNPTAPTATFGDNDTSISTTAFVQAALAGGTAVARNLEVQVRNQSGSTIAAGSIVYISGATGNLPLITLSQANNDANSAQTMGFVKTSIANNGTGYVIVRGEVENLNTSALTEGTQLYLSPSTAGTWTTTKPYAPQHLVYVGVVIRSHPTLGTILVAVQNGYELDELHDVSAQTPSNNDLLAFETSTSLWKNKTAATLGLAPLASPTFTGTPSLPTGTTGITQTAGDNTTKLATTAFVTSAVPAFASVSDVLTGSSTATAINPLLHYVGNLNPAYFSPDVAQLSSTVTGTGSSSTLNANGYTVQLGSTAGSYATRSQTLWPNRVAVTGNLQWTRPVGFGARVAVYNRMDANAQFGISFGQATATLATPTVRSIGCYFGASSANTPGVLVLEVHNGTTYTTVNSSYTPTFNLLFDVVCYSDGAGNVTLYVNGSQVATTSAGPSTNGGTTYQTVLQAGYKAIGTPTGTSNSIFNCLKFLTN